MKHRFFGLMATLITALPALAQNGNSDYASFHTFADIVIFLIAATAAVFAYFLRKDFKAEQARSVAEINALKVALKKRQEETQSELDRLNREIVDLKLQLKQRPAETVVKVAHKPQIEREKFPKQLYLTRPDERGVFMGVSSVFEPGNSLFELTTPDGRTGSFKVIDDADVHHLALMMPTENLTRACTGNNIQVSGGMRRIVTEAPGKAVCENGAWRVTEMARISYHN